jgi:hypothetical protein
MREVGKTSVPVLEAGWGFVPPPSRRHNLNQNGPGSGYTYGGVSVLVPGSRTARFAVLYYSHILTTIPVPIALLATHLVTQLQALSLVLLLAGSWTLLGAAIMNSADSRQLRRLYIYVGGFLVALSIVSSV